MVSGSDDVRVDCLPGPAVASERVRVVGPPFGIAAGVYRWTARRAWGVVGPRHAEGSGRG